MEILVDGPRLDASTSLDGRRERTLIDQVVEVANAFSWPFGNKRLEMHCITLCLESILL